MSELFADKKRALKEVIKALHAGAQPDDMKGKFKEVLESVGPEDISKVEEELIKDGMPREEVQRLCDVHLRVLREALEKPKTELPPGHPIHILLKEHEFVKSVVGEMPTPISRLEKAKDFSGIGNELTKIAELLRHLKEYEKHKVREENSLFPYLEKHGVTQPPAVMWTEHDEQRKQIKEATKVLENRGTLKFEEFKGKFLPPIKALAELIPNHFFKEENILFPTALSLFSDTEWREIKASMDELGYCYFTPKDAIGEKVKLAKESKEQKGEIDFETGSLTLAQLEAMLNTLPVELTFIDQDDTVRYFNQPKDKPFARAKTVLGRKVQQCHPQKSIHLVNQIVEEMKSGKRDVAEFWVGPKDKKTYIRFFAVRDGAGKYLGCLEVVQEVADIQKLEGEKRLL